MLLWVWLLAGAIIFLYGAITGDGLAGAILYHQLKTQHVAMPMIVSEVLFIFLCLPPAAFLLLHAKPAEAGAQKTMPAPRNYVRSLLLGGLFGGALQSLLRPGGNIRMRTAAALLLFISFLSFTGTAWAYLTGEDRSATYEADINLNTMQPVSAVQTARVSGVLQSRYGLSYREESEVKGTSYGRWHNFVPFTEAGWSSTNVVRVLLETDQAQAISGNAIITGHFGAKPPGYVRRVLQDKGLHFADSLITLTTEKMDDQLLGFALAIGVVALAMSFVFAFASNAKPVK